MFERFTEKAIKTIMLAQEEARRVGHNFVGSEQILLGLIGEGSGLAAMSLRSMGVKLKDARVEVEKIIGRGSGFVAVEIPFTPRAKRILENSWNAARKVNDNFIGTEHLLLGLIAEGEGVACRVLEILGVDLMELHTRVLKARLKNKTMQTVSLHSVLTAARDEAVVMTSVVLKPEHLLLALSRCKTESFATYLEKTGINESNLRNAVHAVRKEHGDNGNPILFPLCVRLAGFLRWPWVNAESRAVLSLAEQKRRNMTDPAADANHILLALVSSKDVAVSEILSRLGVDSDDLIQFVENFLKQRDEQYLTVTLGQPMPSDIRKTSSGKGQDLPTDEEIARLFGLDQLRAGRAYLRKYPKHGERVGSLQIEYSWKLEIRPSFEQAAVLCVMKTVGEEFEGKMTDGWLKLAFATADDSAIIEIENDPISEILRQMNLLAQESGITVDGIGYKLTLSTPEVAAELSFANPRSAVLRELEGKLVSLAEQVVASVHNEALSEVLQNWKSYVDQ
jgi:ATP-dependent Clp protease ATP-binding subunit ClpA